MGGNPEGVERLLTFPTPSFINGIREMAGTSLSKPYGGIGAFLRLILGLLFIWGCAYRLTAGPLVPLEDVEQASGMKVSDDGTVTYVLGRLEVALRPMTDEELDRQFASASKGGRKSTNPYTFGDWRPRGGGRRPNRFTVFRLKVKNYAYPKMKVDALNMRILSENGREYFPLTLSDLKEYYYPFVVGYAGNAYVRFEERKDLLQRTLYSGGIIFSGQEQEGYVVFPKLHDDVREIMVKLQDIALRFDSWNRPVETLDLEFRFQRNVYQSDRTFAERSSP